MRKIGFRKEDTGVERALSELSKHECHPHGGSDHSQRETLPLTRRVRREGRSPMTLGQQNGSAAPMDPPPSDELVVPEPGTIAFFVRWVREQLEAEVRSRSSWGSPHHDRRMERAEVGCALHQIS